VLGPTNHILAIKSTEKLSNLPFPLRERFARLANTGRLHNGSRLAHSRKGWESRLDKRVSVEIRDGLCTISEAQEYLSIGRTKLYALMDAGEIPYVKLGRARRIPRNSLALFVNKHLEGGTRL